MSELLVSGGTVVTMDQERRTFRNGAIAVKDNKIIEIGKSGELVKKYRPDKIIDAEGRLIIPGFINVHHHTQSSTVKMRGIQNETTGSLYGRSMPIKESLPDKDRYYLGLTAILADIRMGVTTDVDQDFGEKNIAQAMMDSGIRAVCSEYIYAVDFQETKEKGYKVFAPEIGEASLKRGLELIEKWDGKANGRITCDLAPHAPDTTTPELLGKIREEADKHGKRITIHLAQMIEEVKEIRSAYGITPFQYLYDNNILGSDCYAAHCVHHTDQDIQLLAKTDTKVCHCPIYWVIRGETAPLIPWIEAGITVGIGLDDNPDMIRFMQAAGIMAAYRSKWLGQGYRPRAQKLLELATIEAAKVVGLEKEIGSLEVGKKADITIIDMRKPHLKPSMDPVMDLIYFGNGNDVETVIVDGKVVVESGQILTVDMYNVMKNAQSAGEHAWNKFHEE